MNRIYFFSGTGNSLDVAEKIGAALPDCELIAIHEGADAVIPVGYERLGFVFPSYAGGPPSLVAEFIRNIKLPEQSHPYLFAVITYGGNTRNVLPLVAGQFGEQSLYLDYTAKIMSYPNLMPTLWMAYKLINRRTRAATQSVVKDVLHKQHTANPAPKAAAQVYYANYMKTIHDSDKNYYINGNCVSCGMCVNICPAKNITLENGKPAFHHACESCLACVNYCPKHAINTGKKEQSANRYTHPEVAYKRIAAYYHP